MEDTDEKFVGKTEPERIAGKPGEYDQLFARIAGTNILPSAESQWSPENLEQTLDQVFKDYGNAALEANGEKIYMTLSGGLDSTLAIALLRKNFPNSQIITFTMGGTENHPDIIHARLAAARFGTDHHEFIPTPDEMADALAEYKTKFPEDDLQTAEETGDSDVYLLYKYISRFNPKVLLVHDGIDELMGGYWDHRKDSPPEEKTAIYKGFWDKLIPEHLAPLTATSSEFGIGLMFPYLDQRITKIVANIPLDDRSDVAESKKPLRATARKIGVPEEILTRAKRGQIGMLDLK